MKMDPVRAPDCRPKWVLRSHTRQEVVAQPALERERSLEARLGYAKSV